MSYKKCILNKYYYNTLHKRINIYHAWVIYRLKSRGFNVYLFGDNVKELMFVQFASLPKIYTNAKIGEIKNIFNSYKYISRKRITIHFMNGYLVNIVILTSSSIKESIRKKKLYQ